MKVFSFLCIVYPTSNKSLNVIMFVFFSLIIVTIIGKNLAFLLNKERTFVYNVENKRSFI